MRKLLLTTALVALGLGVATMPVQAQEMRIALSTFEKGLDPQDNTGNSGAPMLYQIYDTLIERDSFSTPLSFKPGLATEWTQIEPTVWELKLREGVVFHNGDTFDADDVEFSLDRMYHHEDPEFFSAWGRWHYNFKDAEVIDPYTIRIHTLRPEPAFLTLISSRSAGITSKDYQEEVGFDTAKLNPVGTGPYKVATFVPGESLVLERFDKHWGEPAALDKVTMLHVPEVASRITGLVNNEFDLITNIPPDQANTLNVEGVRTQGVTWPMFHVWLIHQNVAPTDNPLVRQALRLCTDRKALVDGLWNGLAETPTAHQFAEYGAPLYIEGLDLIKYDPEEGRRLLAEAGYNGEEMVVSHAGNYYLYGDLAAQVIQQQWAECGLNLRLQEEDWATFHGSQPHDSINFRTWSNPMYYPDPMGAMDTHWSPKSWASQRKLWTPSHPEWEATYEAARFETDLEKRRAAYQRLLEISEEESGWLLLYKPHELYAMREGISFDIPIAQRPYVIPLRGGEITVKK
ncbi:MAG: ABC transporter substrate-binding protein [Pseudomonadota bacterium]